MDSQPDLTATPSPSSTAVRGGPILFLVEFASTVNGFRGTEIVMIAITLLTIVLATLQILLHFILPMRAASHASISPLSSPSASGNGLPSVVARKATDQSVTGPMAWKYPMAMALGWCANVVQLGGFAYSFTGGDSEMIVMTLMALRALLAVWAFLLYIETIISINAGRIRSHPTNIELELSNPHSATTLTTLRILRRIGRNTLSGLHRAHTPILSALAVVLLAGLVCSAAQGHYLDVYKQQLRAAQSNTTLELGDFRWREAGASEDVRQTWEIRGRLAMASSVFITVTLVGSVVQCAVGRLQFARALAACCRFAGQQGTGWRRSSGKAMAVGKGGRESVGSRGTGEMEPLRKKRLSDSQVISPKPDPLGLVIPSKPDTPVSPSSSMGDRLINEIRFILFPRRSAKLSLFPAGENHFAADPEVRAGGAGDGGKWAGMDDSMRQLVLSLLTAIGLLDSMCTTALIVTVYIISMSVVTAGSSSVETVYYLTLVASWGSVPIGSAFVYGILVYSTLRRFGYIKYSWERGRSGAESPEWIRTTARRALQELTSQTSQTG
ncbi:hypothetical protein HDU96_008295 [Phlyctochytrium bullatum]|nr:hypothetical protein HDU96_008295 [Phlyctochytrium bullatum]